MPRKRLIRNDFFPYHIYGRSNNREWFTVPKQDIWDICMHEFRTVSDRYQACIHSFTLMSNHFHLLISTPLSNIDAIMNYWMREVSRKIAKSANRINRIFGGRYKWSLIQTDIYYSHVYRYVYQNPIAARICERVADYPFSTFYHLYYDTRLPFCLKDIEYVSRNECIPMNMEKRHAWLNQAFSDKEHELIRRGLRRSVFDIPIKNGYLKARKKLLGSWT